MPAHTRIVIYPYSRVSDSARLLANALSTIRVREGGTYQHRPRDLVVNWGNSALPNWGSQAALANMLNKPQHVANASDKVRTFRLLQETMAQHIPPWTTSQATARGWLENPIYGNLKNAVVCRTLTRANSGRGIVLAGAVAELVSAPLYTRYKPKTAEYRVHINTRFGVVDIQQKRRRNGLAENAGSKYIRSHDNGWVFCRDGVIPPAGLLVACEQAVNILGLDFGAVDVGYHPDYGLSIYEVNTAPGIEGQTLTNYANTFRRFLQT